MRSCHFVHAIYVPLDLPSIHIKHLGTDIEIHYHILYTYMHDILPYELPSTETSN
jgi:methionine synthase II (cobalamin-independent)